MNTLQRQTIRLATGLTIGSLGLFMGHAFGKEDAQYDIAALNKAKNCAAHLGETVVKAVPPPVCEKAFGYADQPLPHHADHSSERLLPTAKTVLASSAYEGEQWFIDDTIHREEQLGTIILITLWGLVVLGEAEDRRMMSK